MLQGVFCLNEHIFRIRLIFYKGYLKFIPGKTESVNLTKNWKSFNKIKHAVQMTRHKFFGLQTGYNYI